MLNPWRPHVSRRKPGHTQASVATSFMSQAFEEEGFSAASETSTRIGEVWLVFGAVRNAVPDSPRIASRRLASPCLALPHNGSPRRAAPRLAAPRLASRRLAWPHLASPRLASPPLASPRLRLASPRLALPRLPSLRCALPRLASLALAEPGLARLASPRVHFASDLLFHFPKGGHFKAGVGEG